MRNLTNEEKEFFEMLISKNPTEHQGYMRFRITIEGRNQSHKRSRVIMQLHLGKKLERWELVHHKDGNKKNDSIENLEILNFDEHAEDHHNVIGRKPKNWKPANTISQNVQSRIKELSSDMIKINCSEISRRLESEGIKISSMAVKKYL